MKTTRLVLTTIVSVALVQGRAFAAPRAASSQQASAASSSTTASSNPGSSGEAAPVEDAKQHTNPASPDPQHEWHGSSDEKHRSGDASQTMAHRPWQLANNKNTSRFGNRYQPAARGGTIQNKEARYVPVPGVVSAGGPTLSNVRHRSPNPAIVGGSRNTIANSTGAINGTRMNHKP